MADIDQIKTRTREVLRQFSVSDLRWSYLFNAVLIVIGAIINILLPHGWTVWPFVLAAGIMTMVHEAAERNGEGVPPLHAYGFFIGAIVVWIVLVTIFSVVNPFVLVLGILGLGYHSGRAYMKARARMKLIETRRAEGKCIHCGEPINKDLAYCEECGEEPDPMSSQLQRVASTIQQTKKTGHARQVLTPESNVAAMTRKERSRLTRRERRTGRR